MDRVGQPGPSLAVSTDTAFTSAAVHAAARAHLAVPRNSGLESGARRVTTTIQALTLNIIDTYSRCNPAFRAVEKLPQRILTNPSEGVLNDGFDNEEGNLICRVHDKITHDDTTYTVLDLLGCGTFGQVFKCQNDATKQLVAIKIIKNKRAYYNQGLLEMKIARLLNNTYDPKDERHLVRLLGSFEFRNHMCLVFELLSMSLLDILMQNQFRGLPLSVVQRFTRQILAALVTLEDANIIHCDLKPENILLAPPRSDPAPGGRQQPQTPGGAEQPVKKSRSEAASQAASAATTKEEVPPSLTLASAHDHHDDSTISTMSETGHTETSAATSAAAAAAALTGSAGVGAATEVGTKEVRTDPQQQQQQQQPPHAGGRLGVWSDVKVIDLGSACFEGKTMYSYIQSRFCKSISPSSFVPPDHDSRYLLMRTCSSRPVPGGASGRTVQWCH
jgi:serine/threonine protein kinase